MYVSLWSNNVMIYLYNRSKIRDLFILQLVYFVSCKHLFYFHQFNLFYKQGPYSAHINRIKCISKTKYRDIQTRIINNVFKKCLGPSILSLNGQSMAPCPVCINKRYTNRHKLSIAPKISLKNEGSFPVMNIFLFFLLE